MQLKIKQGWKWVARDANGRFFLFDARPVWQDNRWVCTDEWYNATELYETDVFEIPEEYKQVPAENACWRL